MRIVAGRWRARAIKAPRGEGTRPTSDRVREALFSALATRLGSDLGAASVLDAFAGSGAMGLEALSRGASRVTFVESDRKARSVLTENVKALGAEAQSIIVASDVFLLARRSVPGGPFSLILLDPPYTLDAAEVGGLLDALANSSQLQDGAIISWEHAGGVALSWPAGFAPIVHKRYGSTEVDIASYLGGSERS